MPRPTELPLSTSTPRRRASLARGAYGLASAGLLAAACGSSASGSSNGSVASTTGSAASGSSSSSSTGGSSSGSATTGTSGGLSAYEPATVSTLSGDGVAGYFDGSGGHTGTTQFVGPNGLAVGPDGSIYVADTLGHRIRRLDASGNASTLAGNGNDQELDGTGGPNGSAAFRYPSGIAIDSAGNIYVSDDTGNRIRKIDSTGTTTTFAGNGKPGFLDGSGGPTGTAEFDFNSVQSLGFSGLCIDGSNNLFVVDVTNNAIRKVDPEGNVTTVAGTGKIGSTNGAGSVAEFNLPGGCVVDQSGNIYVADFGNNCVRKIDSSGNVTTLAGNGVSAHHDGSGGPSGTAEILRPAGVAYDPNRDLVFVPDTFADFIQQIAPDGTTTTIAGSVTGWADGPGLSAKFDAPAGMAVDSQGRLLVTEFFGYDVRVLTFQ